MDTHEWSPPNAQVVQVAEACLGRAGRLISQSKSGYHQKYPDHVVAFNGNVCTKEHGKIWWGDIDVTLDKAKIDTLARELGVSVYVLLEKDARFATADDPQFDKALYVAQTEDRA